MAIVSIYRHSGQAQREPESSLLSRQRLALTGKTVWIPAFAGMTGAQVFDDARGSATECAAALDALVVKHFVTKEGIHAGKELLERIVSMLTRLVQLYETERKVMEDSEDYEP